MKAVCQLCGRPGDCKRVPTARGRARACRTCRGKPQRRPAPRRVVRRLAPRRILRRRPVRAPVPPRGAHFIEVVRTKYPHRPTQARVHLEGPGNRRTLFEGPVGSPRMQALIRQAKGAPRVTVTAQMVRDPGVAAYNRGSKVIAAQFTRVRVGRHCTGKMVNGPNKNYARCGRCGKIDYEKYEGDTCGRLIVSDPQRHGLRRDPASLAAEKARWDKLRADYLVATEAASAQERSMRIKYGDANYRHWASAGDKSKLEKLRARQSKIGDKLMAMVLRLSPRGEAWMTGAPAYWIREKLTWEDMIRPRGEALSVVVPAPWGASHGLTDPRRRR